jgi:hypothetical protein
VTLPGNGWYVAAVAILASALSNPLVESLANRGWLGGAPGSFDDNDHSSASPALCLGLAIALVLCIRRGFVHGCAAQEDWMPRVVARLSSRARASDIVWIVAAQLGALFTMENLERLAAGAQFARGLTWLGGPPAASLAIHALIGVAVALCAARAVRSLADACTAIVRAAIHLATALTARSGARCFVRRLDRRPVFARRVFAPQIAGRAPPSPAAA